MILRSIGRGNIGDDSEMDELMGWNKRMGVGTRNSSEIEEDDDDGDVDEEGEYYSEPMLGRQASQTSNTFDLEDSNIAKRLFSDALRQKHSGWYEE